MVIGWVEIGVNKPLTFNVMVVPAELAGSPSVNVGLVKELKMAPLLQDNTP